MKLIILLIRLKGISLKSEVEVKQKQFLSKQVEAESYLYVGRWAEKTRRHNTSINMWPAAGSVTANKEHFCVSLCILLCISLLCFFVYLICVFRCVLGSTCQNFEASALCSWFLEHDVLPASFHAKDLLSGSSLCSVIEKSIPKPFFGNLFNLGCSGRQLRR